MLLRIVYFEEAVLQRMAIFGQLIPTEANEQIQFKNSFEHKSTDAH